MPEAVAESWLSVSCHTQGENVHNLGIAQVLTRRQGLHQRLRLARPGADENTLPGLYAGDRPVSRVNLVGVAILPCNCFTGNHALHLAGSEL